jgi:hypothetical protein
MVPIEVTAYGVHIVCKSALLVLGWIPMGLPSGDHLWVQALCLLVHLEAGAGVKGGSLWDLRQVTIYGA